jgi:hypothetical protein
MNEEFPKYAYDIECFKNFFSCTFVNVQDEKDVHVFCIGLEMDDRAKLVRFLSRKMTLIGYNNHSYDDPMLRYAVTHNTEKLVNELYQLSSKLIDDNFRADKKIIELRYPKAALYLWDSIDLMKILAFDKLGISLKQTAINLKWHKIQDMPVKVSENIREKEIQTILDYNLNDVLITKRLYEELTPLRELRDDLSKNYNVDLRSASDSKMANLILENIYANELKMDIRSIRDMRTIREKVALQDCIAKFISFKTPQLQELLNRISSMYVYSYNDYRYSEKIYFANCTFALGIGGLHTEDEPGIFVSDNDYLIQDMDVASYYPNLIINNGFYPEHLGKNFIRVLQRITKERLDAKKAGDKVKADGLKITINSIFGKLGSQHFWLLDAKQMLSTTLSGQLGLLMLVENLYLNGIEVISANTDGLVCKIPRKLENKYYEIAKEWETTSGLQLEFTPYKKYVRRDVNSYITEKADGSTKAKGAFLQEVDMKKAYHMPIVAKSLYAYFIKGIPIRETLENCKDIMEFCISQKTGGNFVLELHDNKGVQTLQKTNRFYISKKGGSLIKREMYSNRLIGLYVGRLATILNEFDPNTPFESYQVDLSFYEKEALKIVDEIEPKQMTLFEMASFKNRGEISSTDFVSSQPTIIDEENPSIIELNRLGKNQLIKKIESMVEKYQKVDGVSPRYIYIVGFNAKDMEADVYCLAKGTRRIIGVEKPAYRKNGLEKGQIVYCTKFKKTEYGHTIEDYKITTKLEEYKEELI